MASVTIVIADAGERSVTFTTQIDGLEAYSDEAPPSMILAMAARALFENGMLAEAGQVALACIGDGRRPADEIRKHFKEEKE